MNRSSWIIAAACIAIGSPALGQGSTVVDTPHNLSVSGPGAIRAVTEAQVCIFCHTPHRAAPIEPLWNRRMPVAAYTIYASSSLDARPGQPAGTSKMCLSCHDGTIALGSVLSRDQTIQMAGGITTLPAGGSNLGTDLSDDHPISFRFDSQLALRDRRLADPGVLPESVHLDGASQVQCRTCHDPHDNSYGQFLVMDNSTSALCTSCHQISDTTIVAHEDCRACHQSHSAPSGPHLLTGATANDTCLECHDGSYFGADPILSDLGKFSTHDTTTPADPIEPIPGHVTCASCHEPHTMSSGGLASAPTAPSSLGLVTGINSSGARVDTVSFEYEICFRCHADENVTRTSYISRQVTQVNTRLEFLPDAVSFHPVITPGRNSNVPSLRPAWNESSVIYCGDCHGSDTSEKAGGSGPNGPHGSNEPPLLLLPYSTADFTPESARTYALCYRCHDREGRNGILGDRSFLHNKHVVDARTPCSVCHDAHGVSSLQGNLRNHAHLINLATTVVFAEPTTGLIEFEDTGSFSGNCTLLCHGVPHISFEYAQ
ncbi:MAG: cytochrome c3 family protein [Planctomycetota bacterium]|jgi:predicted CXXCH cytochrome family protein